MERDKPHVLIDRGYSSQESDLALESSRNCTLPSVQISFQHLRTTRYVSSNERQFQEVWISFYGRNVEVECEFERERTNTSSSVLVECLGF